MQIIVLCSSHHRLRILTVVLWFYPIKKCLVVLCTPYHMLPVIIATSTPKLAAQTL